MATSSMKARSGKPKTTSPSQHSDIMPKMNIYTYVNQEEQAAAINKLPGV